MRQEGEIKGFRKRIIYLFDLFNESRISVYSGQTAFFLMLSFFPFLLFFFTLLNLTPLTEADFLDWMLTIIPESFEGMMIAFANEIYAGSTGGKLSVTIIVALWLSSKSFFSLQQGLNSMYCVREDRNYFLLRFYAVLHSLGFAVVLILILALLVFGNQIHDEFLVNANLKFIEDLLHMRLWICVPMLFLVFLLLYTLLPNRKQRIRDQLPGALFAASVWILFSVFFSIYVDEYSSYSSFYGAMTAIALLMIWLYGCMYVLFLGGLINRALEDM